MTILLHPTNIEFVVCIDQSSQQDFAVDGTSTEESTSYAISILTKFRPVSGGLHDNVHRTNIKYIFSALLLMFILRRYANIFFTDPEHETKAS